MKILANNLKRQYDLHASEYEEKALQVLRSGWYILGSELSSFETEFAAYLGAEHCAGVASGLDALTIAFRALNIQKGDEVIVSANAYIACVMGISINGATPVFVEPDAYDNIDADQIEAKITGRTKAILAVHLYGQSCDMTKIMAVAEAHHLKVVEDCAQSHGTKWQGQTCGTIGDIGCFSFYPTKGLGAFGDAGAVVTKHPEIDAFVRMYRNYGSRKHYYNEVVGMNSRLDEIQAGLLRVKLQYLDQFNAERNRIAERYIRELHNPLVRCLTTRPGSTNTWHQFEIHTPKRDALMDYLAGYEIGTIIHYPIPPHLSEAYAYLGLHAGDFPVAEKNAHEILSLPMYNGMTDEEQSFVIEKINAFHPQEEN
jgi:dTDP-4-amino-4,6-dideoxygalactose transaminase